MELTAAQVEQMAPDAASIKAAGKLTGLRSWADLGQSPELLWGRCQGSRAYDVKVVRADYGFHCTCPSRKFPCKHVLALLTVAANDDAALPAADAPPDWVAEWFEARQEKQAKKAEKAAEKAAKKPPDPKAQAKRAAAREAKVQDGLERLELWIADLVRRGLAEVQGQPHIWHEQARRLVDSQAATLAGTVERLGETIGRGPDWTTRLLGELGQVQLLIDAARNPSLPLDLRADVRQQIGYSLSADEVHAHGDVVADRWAVVGQWVNEFDRVTSRRTWLIGAESGRTAMQLDFAAGNRPLPPTVVPGTSAICKAAFYPGAVPQRVRLGEIHEVKPLEKRLAGRDSIAAALETWANQLSRQPWLGQTLLALRDVRLEPPHSGNRAGVERSAAAEGVWHIVDRTGAALPLLGAHHWRQLATLGPGRCDITGEWDGERLRLLGTWSRGGGERAEAGSWSTAE